MIEITVHIRHAGWKAALRPCEKTVRAVCEAALPKSRRKRELSVVLASDAFIRDLNKTYRGKDKATNVLAFSYLTSPLMGEVGAHAPGGGGTRHTPHPNPPPQGGREPIYLGDIVLAFQTVKREAKEQKKSLRDHATHLLVHGTLHLAGYDHMLTRDAAVMERKEIKILESLGVANPYL